MINCPEKDYLGDSWRSRVEAQLGRTGAGVRAAFTVPSVRSCGSSCLRSCARVAG
jgi:hypothetical protein